MEDPRETACLPIGVESAIARQEAWPWGRNPINRFWFFTFWPVSEAELEAVIANVVECRPQLNMSRLGTEYGPEQHKFHGHIALAFKHPTTFSRVMSLVCVPVQLGYAPHAILPALYEAGHWPENYADIVGEAVAGRKVFRTAGGPVHCTGSAEEIRSKKGAQEYVHKNKIGRAHV